MSKRFEFIAAAGLLIFGAAGVWAQDTGGVTAPEGTTGIVLKNRAPVAKELLQVRFPRPKEYKLANGLRILVLEDHRAPSIRLSLTMPGGSLTEPKPGVAGFTANMLNEGTATRTPQQMSELQDQTGISVGAGSSLDRNSLSVSALSEQTDEAVALFTDVLLHPSFPQERIDRAKRLRQFGGFGGGGGGGRRGPGGPGGGANPAALAQRQLNRTLYGDTPYARADRNPGALTALTREDLVQYHDRYYRPNGAILGISGDVNGKKLVKKLEKALADWKPGDVKSELPKAEFKSTQDTKIYLIDRPGSAQTTLLFGTLGIQRNDPDYFALTVANRILGGGSSGRLFQNIRERKGYTYGAYSTLTAPRWTGLWTASASVRNEVTAPAAQEFLAEFKRIQDQPVTADELARAKRAIIGGFARTLESPEGILNRAIELVEYGLPADYWDTYSAKIEAVNAADVQRVAKKYLGGGHIQAVAVGERSQIEEGLRKLGAVEIVSGGRPNAQASGESDGS